MKPQARGSCVSFRGKSARNASTIVILAASAVLLYGCPPPPPPPPPPGNTGINQQALTGTLTIVVAGSGRGMVGKWVAPNIHTVGGPSCDDIRRRCNTEFPVDGPNASDTSITLAAQAGTGEDSVFVGWAGACSGTAPRCTLRDLGGPIPVIALFRKTTVAAGAWFTCGLKTDGTVMCWGENNNGELGDGTRNMLTNGVAHRVTLPASRTAVDISANGYHACALLDDASVFCWGSADHGATGPAGGGLVPLPRPAMGVAAGSYHSCAVLATTGTATGGVSCWGYDADGQVDGHPGGGDVTTPRPVPGMGSAIAVTAGAYHSCALRSTSQDVLCWGHNADHEFGTSAPFNGMASSPLKPLGGAIARIAAGVGAGVVGPSGGYNTCLQDTSGVVICAGNNYWQQVTPTSLSFVPGGEGTLRSTLPRPFSSIAVGGYFMCAVGDDHRVYCWGDGSKGQLGNGSEVGTAVSSATIAAALPDQAWSVAAGAYHACAVVGHHTVRCWGLNNWGQTGAVSGSANSLFPVTPSW